MKKIDLSTLAAMFPTHPAPRMVTLMFGPFTLEAGASPMTHEITCPGTFKAQRFMVSPEHQDAIADLWVTEFRIGTHRQFLAEIPLRVLIPTGLPPVFPDPPAILDPVAQMFLVLARGAEDARAEIARAQENYDEQCSAIADMHAHAHDLSVEVATKGKAIALGLVNRGAATVGPMPVVLFGRGFP